MIVKNSSILTFIVLSTLLFNNCKDGNSLFDPDYVAPNESPVITSITPTNGYLAGVDSVIITGTGFSTDADELTVNFGGSAGIVRSASETELVVRPGTIPGNSVPVRVSKRGAEFFSEQVNYILFDPFNLYPGTDDSDTPNTPIAVDGSDNVYTIINRGGIIRYTRIAPDGTVTKDGVKFPGEPRPDPNNTSPYPVDSTMRFISYSDIEIGPGGVMFITQPSIQAIFTKTFGDGRREGVWSASSTGSLDISDMVFDNNGYLWVVGRNSDQIHRFTVANKSEAKFPFTGALSSIAFYAPNNELYVGGNINETQQVWKFTIDGSGNIGAGSLYFDFAQFYNGNIRKMILASNGELLIATGTSNAQIVADEGIVRVFPDGKHEPFYDGMLKGNAFGITWRSDKYAVVVNNGDDASVNFMDMFDRTRAGIFGF